MSKVVLEVVQLTKQYGGKQALGGVSFQVKEGSCFGLLGPNGAGKSTTMKIITGILRADSGEALVMGQDMMKHADAVRHHIGYVPQEITLYDKLSARQNLTFFGEMYGVKGRELKSRIEEVLGQVGLADRAGEAVGSYSGGMKRRINFAAALLHHPKIVILDEPTVGIDPQSRNHIFEMIRSLRDSGMSVIYSTHYMEEVEALCDDIAIIDHGKVVVQGSLHELLEQYAVKAVYVEADRLEDEPSGAGVRSAVRSGRGWLLETERPLQTMQQISGWLEETGRTVRSLELKRRRWRVCF